MIFYSVITCFALAITAFADTTSPVANAPATNDQSEATSSQATAKKTRLRILGSPEGTFRHIITTRLLSVKVTVQNAGETEALGVRVEAISPTGQTHQLSGPQTIGPKDQALFSGSMNEVITTNKKLSARVSCDNCY